MGIYIFGILAIVIGLFGPEAELWILMLAWLIPSMTAFVLVFVFCMTIEILEW